MIYQLLSTHQSLVVVIILFFNATIGHTQTTSVATEGPKCYYYRWSHRVGSMDVVRGPLTELRCRIAVAEKRQVGHKIEEDCNCSPEDRERALNGNATYVPIRSLGVPTSSDCGSRNLNQTKLTESSVCFTGANASLMKDIQQLLGELDCGVFLDGVTCSGNEIRLSWYTKDLKGTRVNISNLQQTSIDHLYAELKARSKERRMDEVERQMEQAQRREDVEALISEMSRLVEDIKAIRETQQAAKAKSVDTGSERETYGREPSIADPSTGNSSIAQENTISGKGEQITMDTDGDGIDDAEATMGADGQISYRDIRAKQAMQEVNKATDVNAMLDLGVNDPEVVPIATDGWLRVVEKSENQPLLTVPHTYVNNGILTSQDDAITAAKAVAVIIDQPVVMSWSETTNNLIDDAELAMDYFNGRSDIGTRAEAEAIYKDLKDGQEVRIIAHSRGFARTQCVAKDLEYLVLSRNEIPSSDLSRVSIVGVGAFSNPNFQWPEDMVVVKAVNRTDPVPHLSGDRPFGQTVQDWDMTFQSHSFSEYYNWVDILTDPRLDLRLLNGRTLYDEDYKGILDSLGR
jgi:hypothetical protein